MDISTITSLGSFDPLGANAGAPDAPRDAAFQKLLGRLFDDLAPKTRPMERPPTRPAVAERPAPKPQAPERPEPRARAERPEPKPAQTERSEPNRASERSTRPGSTAEARSRPPARTTQTERSERTEPTGDHADEAAAVDETDVTMAASANTEADRSKAEDQDAATQNGGQQACDGGMPTAPLEAAATPTEPDLDELLALLFAADAQTADAAEGAEDAESLANAQTGAAVNEDDAATAEQAAAEAAMAAALAAGARPTARNGAAGGAAGDGQRAATPTGPGAGDAAADAAATAEAGATDGQTGATTGDAKAAADFAANLADTKAETRATRAADDAGGAKAAQSARTGNGEAQAANANGANVNGPAAAGNAPAASQGTGNAAAGNENALRGVAATEASSATTSTHHATTGAEGLRPAQGQDFASTVTTLRPMRGSNAPQHAGVVDQVTVQLQRGIKEGNDRIALQLRPEELGRIDILLEFGADGRVAATVQADRAQTLELLQRDSRNLERALQDAGLKADAGSLSFNLRGDNHQQNQRANQGHDHGGKGDGFGAALAGNANEADGGDRMAALNRWIANPGRLDVRI